MNYLKRFYQGFIWWLVFVCLLVTCLWGSWHLWAKLDFAYPQLYEQLDIEQHISEYGPQNRYKSDFELTTKEERFRLFSETITAIYNQGQGLDVMVYHAPSEQPIDLMLREPEVQHLKDVANLVDIFYTVSLVALLLLIGLVVLIYCQKLRKPGPKYLAMMTLLPVSLSVLSVLLIGPTAVFYQLHIWVFPDGHEWFFYYQESLMTTLMKAPDLFGYIALLWLGSALIMWAVMIVLLHLLYKLTFQKRH